MLPPLWGKQWIPRFPWTIPSLNPVCANLRSFCHSSSSIRQLTNWAICRRTLLKTWRLILSRLPSAQCSQVSPRHKMDSQPVQWVRISFSSHFPLLYQSPYLWFSRVPICCASWSQLADIDIPCSNRVLPNTRRALRSLVAPASISPAFAQTLHFWVASRVVWPTLAMPRMSRLRLLMLRIYAELRA